MCWGGVIEKADAYALSTLMRASTFPFIALCKPLQRGTGVDLLERIAGIHPIDIIINKLQVANHRAQEAVNAEAARRETLQQDRILREDQEREYAETVAADRERLRIESERRELDAKRKEEEEEAAAIALSQQLSTELDLVRKRKAVLPEPERGVGVAQFRFNLPNGMKLQRRFRDIDTLLDIRNYLDVYFADNNIALKNYDLATNFPKKTFAAKDNHLSIVEAGVQGNTSLFIYDLDA